jgi:predicted nucleic acid-binding protein
MIYFDTAFLVKLYLEEEPGSRRFLSFVQNKNDVIVSSILAKMETEAAFHRKLRERQLRRTVFLKVLEQFAQEIQTGLIAWLPLSPGVVERVHLAYRNLPSDIFLRTGDAIHLATASEAGFKEIYSNDRHLLSAASLFKLKGINPLDGET